MHSCYIAIYSNNNARPTPLPHYRHLLGLTENAQSVLCAAGSLWICMDFILILTRMHDPWDHIGQAWSGWGRYHKTCRRLDTGSYRLCTDAAPLLHPPLRLLLLHPIRTLLTNIAPPQSWFVLNGNWSVGMSPGALRGSSCTEGRQLRRHPRGPSDAVCPRRPARATPGPLLRARPPGETERPPDAASDSGHLFSLRYDWRARKLRNDSAELGFCGGA